MARATPPTRTPPPPERPAPEPPAGHNPYAEMRRDTDHQADAQPAWHQAR